MKALGDYLEKTGITHAAFAADLGISQPTVTNLVNGRHSASSDLLKRISQKTGRSVDELLMTDEEWEVFNAPPRPPKRPSVAAR